MDISKLNVWDSSSHLKSDQDIALYLESCLEEAGNDSIFMSKAIQNTAKAKLALAAKSAHS